MIARGARGMSLRLDQSELKRLAWALGISLAIHLFCYGTYELGKELGVWQKLHWPAWLHKSQSAAEIAKARQLDQQAPLMFVETTPSQAVTEAPKDAKYYSDKNARAANPDAAADTDMPKIEGTQDKVAKTEEASREKFPLQPSRPVEEEQPKAAMTPGDLALAKPNETPRNDQRRATQPQAAHFGRGLGPTAKNSRRKDEAKGWRPASVFGAVVRHQSHAVRRVRRGLH